MVNVPQRRLLLLRDTEHSEGEHGQPVTDDKVVRTEGIRTHDLAVEHAVEEQVNRGHLYARMIQVDGVVIVEWSEHAAPGQQHPSASAARVDDAQSLLVVLAFPAGYSRHKHAYWPRRKDLPHALVGQVLLIEIS